MSRYVSVALVLALAGIATGCRSKQPKPEQPRTGTSSSSTTTADRIDDGERQYAPRTVEQAKPVGFDVKVERGTILTRKGVLIAKLRVVNRRSDFVQVFFDRCELETASGQRMKRASKSGGLFGRSGVSTITCGPSAESDAFTLIFGRPDAPLQGDSFRLYLWAQSTNGNRFIENVQPVLLGEASSFHVAARPLEGPESGRGEDLPPPTEPPPSLPPDAGGAPADSARQKPCAHCGEPRGTTPSCPHCGMP